MLDEILVFYIFMVAKKRLTSLDGHVRNVNTIHSFSLRSCVNMLRKTGEYAASIAQWASMVSLDALMMMSVWILSDNILPS